MLNCVCSFFITSDLNGLGIGRPPGQMDPKAFHLQPFNKTAREKVKPNN